MSTESKGIYHWKLGDVALARVCQKAYARVRVVKDEKGLFYDDKVLGISGNEDGSLTVTKELCYYVETCRTNHRFWLPYTSLHLAERSRPFYGTEKENKVKNEVATDSPAMRKRNAKEDNTVPLEVESNEANDPDQRASNDNLNTNLNSERNHKLPTLKFETEFKEFTRRGQDNIFDQCTKRAKSVEKSNHSKLFSNVNTSTEDKFQSTTAGMTEKEIDKYLHQCWKYSEIKESYFPPDEETDVDDNSVGSDVESLFEEPVTVHTTWCLVCGDVEDLQYCCRCPAAYHLRCRREWLLTVIHRKSPSNKVPRAVTYVEKILSSTRAKCTVREEREDSETCPSCLWGPHVGYDDIVWYKLGSCGWWPARVLSPGEVPPCLLTRDHAPADWPLLFYTDGPDPARLFTYEVWC